ncbi:putative photosynthetic complex assembly protein PuhE [Methylocystis sp.]|uniref:putative photosynthetic complex assembly protein PuhE n=1 Tax=Methylocystis sp. TaxID=1911079 RepID=UPI0025E03AB0|nr:putative photosynthetic complex assembly protein PuhE [Methylocystis sp.]
MFDYAAPILATLLLWWGSTGAILYLDGLSRRTYAWSMAGATALFTLALWGIVATSGKTTAASAYCAFLCGLTAWAWQLVSYYMGFVTGPRKTACPPHLRGWRRFVEAVRTSLYHEIAIILCAIVLVALTRDQPNQLGGWTFFILWWMHTSAKLNLYFGAPNLSEELLPEHLRFLATFMTRRPMNLFFPLSVTASTIVTVLIAQKALAATTDFELVGSTILATLMALAVAEHWFLVAPLHANALWSWGVKEIRPTDEENTSDSLRVIAIEAALPRSQVNQI